MLENKVTKIFLKQENAKKGLCRSIAAWGLKSSFLALEEKINIP